MHIMEGFLPGKHAAAWTLAAAPFVAYGTFSIQKRIREKPEQRMLLGVAAAFTFVISALKMPSVTGSCSHPTGTGLGAILFGPAAMAAIGAVVLLFQALLLAHGGITTLGANICSMCIIGPVAGILIYRLALKLRFSLNVAVFLAAFFSDLMTYVTTSGQLGLAFPDPVGGVSASFAKFIGVFALTQLPLAVSEGFLTVVIFNALRRVNSQELKDMNVPVPEEAAL